jgi:xanthine dehydrogenase YagS FAD-binding subunit
MRPFAYARPTDPTEAVDLVTSTDGAAYLAGGTNLVDLMKLGATRPTMLVDVGGLGLDAVDELEGGGLRIGGAARNSDVAGHPAVRQGHPLLAMALLAGASGQVRNMATIAGNLLQRTRCGYFQDATKPCNKRVPGSGCPARDGDHRNLSILGGSVACIANHPSDMAVALAAMDATVLVRTRDGRRVIPIDDLYRLPADRPDRDTVLEPGWLIEAVEVPPPVKGARVAYRKVRERASFAFGLASLAASVVVDGDRTADVRLALGAVAPKPWRARTAEAALVDGPLTEETVISAIDAELAAAMPLPDNAFKVPLVRRLVVSTVIGMVGQ